MTVFLQREASGCHGGTPHVARRSPPALEPGFFARAAPLPIGDDDLPGGDLGATTAVGGDPCLESRQPIPPAWQLGRRPVSGRAELRGVACLHLAPDRGSEAFDAGPRSIEDGRSRAVGPFIEAQQHRAVAAQNAERRVARGRVGDGHGHLHGDRVRGGQHATVTGVQRDPERREGIGAQRRRQYWREAGGAAKGDAPEPHDGPEGREA